MNKKKFGLYDFKQRHQSGAIGKFLTYAEDLMIKGKNKLVRGKKSYKSGYKKAIVTLKKGQSIDLSTGI